MSDPKADDSLALQWAAGNGHLEVVKLLLPVSDPKAVAFRSSRQAAKKGRLEIVKLLLPYGNYSEVFERPDFIRAPDCDLMLSCLPPRFIKQFMIGNPTLDFPRTRAMLASQVLRARMVPTKQTTCKRRRA